MPDTALLRTAFHDFHQQHGAKLVPFAEWEMPLHYGSIIDEHTRCREAGALFDVSHMGRVAFTGAGARKLIERLLTRRVSDMGPGRCRYAMVCNEAGGVLDDVIAYRFDDRWMLVVNASNRQKLLAHFAAVRDAEGLKAEIDDQTQRTAMVALQGPQILEVIGRLNSTIPELKRYAFVEQRVFVLNMTVSRTGYTGEDGVEVILDAESAPFAIELLRRRDDTGAIRPAGLGARDTLRIEAGMPLYGHELDEQTDPLSAGLGFAVTLDKGREDAGPKVPRFIGQDALEKIAADGPPKTLIGLKLDGRRTPRQGAEVHAGGEAIGSVTSGCLSPTLGHPIAMAYVKPGAAAVGDAVAVHVGSAALDAEVVELPFYKRG